MTALLCEAADPSRIAVDTPVFQQDLNTDTVNDSKFESAAKRCKVAIKRQRMKTGIGIFVEVDKVGMIMSLGTNLSYTNDKTARLGAR